MRTFTFDADGLHELGDLDVGQLHNVIAGAVGEAGAVIGLPWRIYHGKAYSHTAYAVSAEEAVAAEAKRLGTKGATTLIRAMKADSASD